MDRRYLAATLAIVATFAVMSRGLRSGQMMTLACRGYSALMEHFNEDSSRAIKIHVPLRPSHPEEAQMLAEMNLPLVREQAKAAALVVRQNVQAAKCAREQALRQAAQARREAQKLRQQAMREQQGARAAAFTRPIVVELGDMNGIEHAIHLQTEKLAAADVDFATEQLTRLNNAAVRLAMVQLQSADLASQAAAGAEGSGCTVSRTWSRQLQAQYRNAMRNALHAIQNSVNSRNAVKTVVNTGGYL